MRDYMARLVTLTLLVTSPNWGPPSPFKQVLSYWDTTRSCIFLASEQAIHLGNIVRSKPATRERRRERAASLARSRAARRNGELTCRLVSVTLHSQQCTWCIDNLKGKTSSCLLVLHIITKGNLNPFSLFWFCSDDKSLLTIRTLHS